MIKQIHVYLKVEKDIEQMKSLDNVPGIAALRAQNIIQDLINGMQMSQAGRLSGIKDARIKNLFKFNLGKGYRLVTIKEKKELFVMFIGDHDQCDRWLDACSKKNPHRRPLSMNVYPVICSANKIPDGSILKAKAACEPEDFEDISQKQLRNIFCGLSNNP